MKLRSTLACGALLLSMVSIGSAKTWDIIIGNSTTKAGNVMLPAGNYRLKLDNTNNQAIFIQPDSGKKFTIPVKVEQTPKKVDATTVETKNMGGNDVIQIIDLGGTTEKLNFGD
jgi:hypothetical protein